MCVCIACRLYGTITGGGTFSWPGHKIFEYDFQLKQLHEEDDAACHFFKKSLFLSVGGIKGTNFTKHPHYFSRR